METKVRVPDIGEFEDVEVIDVIVAPGDEVKIEDPLITLESDKATMDIPAPFAGVVKQVIVSLGDKVSEGNEILVIDTTEPAAPGREAPSRAEQARAAPGGERATEAPDERAAPERATEAPDERAAPEPAEAEATAGHEAQAAEAEPEPEAPERAAPEAATARRPAPAADAPTRESVKPAGVRRAHASPSVRRLARELGVDLARVEGRGRKGRILAEDVQAFVRTQVAGGPAARGAAAGAVAPPAMPRVDFAEFGEVELRPESRVRRVAAETLHRAWLQVPHVTQHDEADISELEAFRVEKADEARARGVKLTLLPFVMKAVVTALRELPRFNTSLDPDGGGLVFKKYYHLGIAVDTEHGLIVPVIRDVDRKGLYQLAAELAEAGERARARKLRPEDLRGGSFTISSLGGIGGTAFTPIVNAPEVAILGVSRATQKPVYRDGEFVPRLVLPLSLSYDHRVIDGADAARFTTRLVTLLADIRNLML